MNSTSDSNNNNSFCRRSVFLFVCVVAYILKRYQEDGNIIITSVLFGKSNRKKEAVAQESGKQHPKGIIDEQQQQPTKRTERVSSSIAVTKSKTTTTKTTKRTMPTKLETVVEVPDSKHGTVLHVANMESNVFVVVTHPWGVLGGNLHNNVVVAAVLYFQRLGITTVRFDFAGSQIGRGYGEVDQLTEVVESILSGAALPPPKTNTDASTSASSSSTAAAESSSNRFLPRHVLLVGYSYGSLIAGSASADIPACIGSVSIAPPFAVQHWLLMFNSNYHMTKMSERSDLFRLLVIGSRDNFTSESKFASNVEENFPADTTTGAVIKDADHFFFRREKDVMNVIGEWLVRVFAAQCNNDIRQLRNLSM